MFFLWQYGEERLKLFIERSNKVHSIVECTAERPKTFINLLDIIASLLDGVLETELHAKPTGSHQ